MKKEKLSHRKGDAVSGLTTLITSVRNSVCALLRIRRNNTTQSASPGQAQFQVCVVGTSWCIVTNRYLVTAFHTFNEGRQRNPDDKFFIFAVPGNGPIAHHTPVIGFPIEKSDADMAVIEISPPSNFPVSIPSMPVTFDKPADGEQILTYGFPAPIIVQARVDAQGNWGGGNLFLKGHANEGIVAGQFEMSNLVTYELNVGWHHGESGGPIIRLKSCAAFSIMQRYRDITSPHGVVAGPHQGYSLAAIEKDIVKLGATIV